MRKDAASLATRVAYCFVLLGVMVPFGLAASGWVRVTTGGGAMGFVPFFGPLLVLLFGLYRIFVVARSADTLATPPAQGGLAFVRAAGVLLLYLGAVMTILGWFAGPLMRTMLHAHSESGVEFYFVGVVLAFLGQIGLLGLFLFEFSRLRIFETQGLRAS